MLVAIAGLIWYEQEEALNFVRYEEFGIDMPVDYSIHGIDVSKFQKNINWDAVEQMQVDHIHITFAFIKATEGIMKWIKIKIIVTCLLFRIF